MCQTDTRYSTNLAEREIDKCRTFFLRKKIKTLNGELQKIHFNSACLQMIGAKRGCLILICPIAQQRQNNRSTFTLALAPAPLARAAALAAWTSASLPRSSPPAPPPAPDPNANAAAADVPCALEYACACACERAESDSEVPEAAAPLPTTGRRADVTAPGADASGDRGAGVILSCRSAAPVLAVVVAATAENEECGDAENNGDAD
jgi:hypothetical protein